MPALQHNILIEQGATFQREFTVTNSTGAAFDFTGYTVTAELKTSPGVKVADFIVDVIGNKVLIELTEAATAALAATTNYQHRYVVLATKAMAPDYRIAQGFAIISAV